MRFDSSPECSRCCRPLLAAFQGCQSAGPANGDATDATTEAAAPLKAALLLYTIPLALLFTGYAAGSALAFECGIALAAPAIGAAVGAGVGALLFFGSLGVLRLFLRGEPGARAGRSAIVEVPGRNRQPDA